MRTRQAKRKVRRWNAGKSAIRKPSRGYIEEGSVEHLIDLILDGCGNVMCECFKSIDTQDEATKALKRVVDVSLQLLLTTLNSDLATQVRTDSPTPHESSKANYLVAAALVLVCSGFLMVQKDNASFRPTLKAVKFKGALMANEGSNR